MPESPVSKRLRAIRKERNITQMELSKKSGVAQATISGIERGIQSANSDTISLLAKAMQCTVAELMGESNPKDGVFEQDFRYALFGGAEATDEQYQEVLDYAQYVLQRRNKKS